MVKTLLKLSYPIMVSRLSVVFLEIASVFMVAHLGVQALSAYGVAAPLYLTIYMLSFSFLMVFSVRGSQLLNDKARLSQYLSAGLFISIVLSLMVVVLLCILPVLLPLFGQTQTISQQAGQFFFYITFGMPPLYLTAVLSQAVGLLERPLFVSVTSFLQLIIGAGSVYLFTNVMGMDLKGVALGFDVAYGFRFLCFLIYVPRHCIGLSLTRISKAVFLDHTRFLWQLGWPTSLQYGSELLAVSIATLMIGHLYVPALAAQQIAGQLRVFLLMLPYALSQASSIMIAKYNDPDSRKKMLYAKNVLQTGTATGILMLIPILILINVFSKSYTHLFIANPTPEVLRLTRAFILITSFALLLDTTKYLFAGVLRGLHSTKGVLLSSLVGYCVLGATLAAVLGYALHYGPIGIRIGMLIGLVISVRMVQSYARSKMDTP